MQLHLINARNKNRELRSGELVKTCDVFQLNSLGDENKSNRNMNSLSPSLNFQSPKTSNNYQQNFCFPLLKITQKIKKRDKNTAQIGHLTRTEKYSGLLKRYKSSNKMIHDFLITGSTFNCNSPSEKSPKNISNNRSHNGFQKIKYKAYPKENKDAYFDEDYHDFKDLFKELVREIDRNRSKDDLMEVNNENDTDFEQENDLCLKSIIHTKKLLVRKEKKLKEPISIRMKNYKRKLNKAALIKSIERKL